MRIAGVRIKILTRNLFYGKVVKYDMEKAEEEFFRNAVKPVGSEGFRTRLICSSGTRVKIARIRGGGDEK